MPPFLPRSRPRSRKWTFVRQEATRLAALGVTPAVIATRLGVDRASVARWIQAGKLPAPRPSRRRQMPVPPGSPMPAEAWAAAVRSAYALDATDEALVGLAVAALTAARDPEAKSSERLAAMGRFQALVKQLRLLARQPVDEVAAAPLPPPASPIAPPTRPDPRAQLLATTPRTVQ